MRVGFIGLGNISGRCARHVLAAGHELMVNDLDEAGANSADDPVGGLARLEIDAMLNAIPDRWTDIEVVGPPTWTPHQPAQRTQDPADSVHRRRLISQRPQHRRDVSAASEFVRPAHPGSGKQPELFQPQQVGFGQSGKSPVPDFGVRGS